MRRKPRQVKVSTAEDRSFPSRAILIYSAKIRLQRDIIQYSKPSPVLMYVLSKADG
jgi:hypothetical protein